ncbi:HAMP domain-containing histidine kinase [Allokutzneria sp. A3M-2-11 16]|uniref:sensor histidine kinase n=1 Tax=Allokutzneria sp. A3M-2-11 16 TaxID=2962043 RepID=UPI0020B71CC1|nr:HAMP domain-containing sensor histidine kinase [Allokutzneria sp. A3M-2-11 16]MCP3797717.1 HAMP domain-containing histidine kinase [Allokutzneria sp. A3M-2-11 16]
MTLSSWTSTIRFRMTVTYSAWVFTLGVVVLGLLYLSVLASVDEAKKPMKAIEHMALDNGGSVIIAKKFEAVMHDWERETTYGAVALLGRYSLFALALLFLLSLAVGWWQAGRALRPIRRITSTTREITATDLSRRIALDGPQDELRELAETIDGMLARLNTAFEDQRRLLGDASHELRNPLAIIQTSMDAVLSRDDVGPAQRREATAIVGRALNRMGGLVEDLLATGRRDALAFAEADIELAGIAADAGAEYRLLAEDSGVELTEEHEPGPTVIGDRDALRRAVANVLSNAVRVAPPGSSVRLASGGAGGWCWIAVRDEGPGIPKEDHSRVFDRFWQAAQRSAATSGHSGLGLAIVRQIVEGHGGWVGLDSVPGTGSTFVLWFPDSRREPADREVRPTGIPAFS